MNAVIITLFLFLFVQAKGQEYTLWGPQVSGIASINQKSMEAGKALGYGAGLYGDWLINGDIGRIRLEANFYHYQIRPQANISAVNTAINGLDIPVSYAWTNIAFSNFSLLGGGGYQIIFSDAFKNLLYLQLGTDYTIYPRQGALAYFLGLCAKYSVSPIASSPDIKPLLFILSFGVQLEGTGYN